MTWRRKKSHAYITGRGFTLTEMLVAVAVLSVMLIAFSHILSQVRNVVGRTQLSIRVNAAASAIAEIIRRDFRQIAKEGFLYVKNDCIIATTVGVQHSLTVNATAMGSAVHYALSDDSMLRQAWLLPGGGVVSSSDDIWDNGTKNFDLADFVSMKPNESLAECTKLAANVETVVVPPTNLSEISQLWRLLTTKVSNLEIQWGKVNAGEVRWNRAPASPTLGNGFWTRHNHDEWPDLIKIQFTLSEDSFELHAFEGSLDGVYEVVCRIGQ